MASITDPVISQALPSTLLNLLFNVNPTLTVFCLVPTASPGIADIVGFSTSGVVILRNAITVQAVKVLADFGYDAGGWRVDRHVRILADVGGKRQFDIVGFGEGGVILALNNGNNTFQVPKLVLSEFGYAQGWRVEKHLRFLADIRKTGHADIVGFGDAGVLVSANKGDGVFAPSRLAVQDFGSDGAAGGWSLERHLRFLGNVFGGGQLDIVGFGENSVIVGRNNDDGTGTFGRGVGVLNDMCYNSGGWRIEKHPRFIFDLTGDAKVDLIGCGDAGVLVAFNNGDGTFKPSKLVVNDFGYIAGGWRVERHPRFIADLTGDKRGDIIGFGEEGVWVSLNDGKGNFQQSKKVISDFCYSTGWRVEKHLRFPVDLTGDGCADIIGFGDEAVWVSFNDGKGNFGPLQRLTSAFAYNGGEWSLDKTVRWMANLYL
ncbi:hypothetical protein BDZ97DRAFT_1812023 [Flammula alnicola]|nr:hypothetical protein BDZ97DRAFT_1812023 [Flammula alnicola]